MPNQTRYLLDKVIVRRTVEGLLKLAENRDLSNQDNLLLLLLQQGGKDRVRLLVVPSSVNILTRIEQMPRYGAVVEAFLKRTEVTTPTRYFRRWSRRLQDFGFTRENARMVALATFGTDVERGIFGVHAFVTYDQPLINLWTLKQAEIERRLDAMRRQLFLPYRDAKLPLVLTPDSLAQERQ